MNKTISDLLFRFRFVFIPLFIVITLFFGYNATHLRIDAGFQKMLPTDHSYMETFKEYQEEFGGANRILISVSPKKGDIFQPDFLKVLKKVSEESFFVTGVNRSTIQSIFTPNVRFVEIVDGGFAGGPLVPADFDYSIDSIEQVHQNVLKSTIVGRLVSEDFTAALISLELSDIDPKTGEKVDYIAVGKQLEEELRGPFASDDVQIHVIGFAKAISDIAIGAKGALVYLALAIVVIALLVKYFIGSWYFTLSIIFCSLMGVVWTLGILPLLGYGLDPMSILIPFLIFAIGVSHGIQMTNGVNFEAYGGMSIFEASKKTFNRIFFPGIVALLSDTIGFLTIYFIKIPMIQELAVAASLGVMTLILTNLVLLPMILSYIVKTEEQLKYLAGKIAHRDPLWKYLSYFTRKYVAIASLSVAALLFALSFSYSQQVKIGDMQVGIPELKQKSTYNQDAAFITDKFSIGVDILNVIVETQENAVIDHDVMADVEEFAWVLENNKHVQSTICMPQVMKIVTAGWNEGHFKWKEISRNSQVLVQAVFTIVKNSSVLMNADGSVLPIMVFLKDHKADSINSVIDTINKLNDEGRHSKVKYRLATGNVGIMAAVNDTVADAQYNIILWVYLSIIVLCLMLFRSIRATVCVVAPLMLVSVLAYSLMVFLEIGLKTSTLPVAALGVGIGVDYGIYIFSQLRLLIKEKIPLQEAYRQTLRLTGNAVMITGLALSLSVLTWTFSDLKFQADMGIIFSFMLISNMIAAISLVPAFAYFLYPSHSGEES